MFDSPPVGADNVSKGHLEKAENQNCQEVCKDKSSKVSDEVEKRRMIIEKLNSPPMKRALEQSVNRKRRFEDVIRSPYVEKVSKTFEVPSAEELRGRKKIENPLIAEKLLQVKPWVEV